MKELYPSPVSEVKEFAKYDVLTVSYNPPSGIESGDGGDF